MYMVTIYHNNIMLYSMDIFYRKSNRVYNRKNIILCPTHLRGCTSQEFVWLIDTPSPPPPSPYTRDDSPQQTSVLNLFSPPTRLHLEVPRLRRHPPLSSILDVYHKYTHSNSNTKQTGCEYIRVWILYYALYTHCGLRRAPDTTILSRSKIIIIY